MDCVNVCHILIFYRKKPYGDPAKRPVYSGNRSICEFLLGQPKPYSLDIAHQPGHRRHLSLPSRCRHQTDRTQGG